MLVVGSGFVWYLLFERGLVNLPPPQQHSPWVCKSACRSFWFTRKCSICCPPAASSLSHPHPMKIMLLFSCTSSIALHANSHILFQLPTSFFSFLELCTPSYLVQWPWRSFSDMKIQLGYAGIWTFMHLLTRQQHCMTISSSMDTWKPVLLLTVHTQAVWFVPS